MKGSVTVTLYDGNTPYPQTVIKPDSITYSNKETLANSQKQGAPFVWPAVMEEGFKSFAKQRPDTKIAPTLNGGTIASSLAAMYGSTITYYSIADTSDDKLWALWLKVATKPTTSSSMDTKSTMMANGLPGSHAYSAIRCDRNKGMVTLRNPWGMVSQNSAGFSNNGGKGVTGRGDGVFDITFADWKTYFLDIAAVA